MSCGQIIYQLCFVYGNFFFVLITYEQDNVSLLCASENILICYEYLVLFLFPFYYIVIKTIVS